MNIPTNIVNRFISFLNHEEVLQFKDDALFYVDIETDHLTLIPTDECLVYCIKTLAKQHKHVLDENFIDVTYNDSSIHFETERHIAYKLASNITPQSLSNKTAVIIKGKLVRKPFHKFVVFFPTDDSVTVHVYKNGIHRFYECFTPRK